MLFVDGMRQCWCCQIAGIWIEFHPSGAGSSADGARQTSNTTLIRSRGAVLALMCTHLMHTSQKASFNNVFSSECFQTALCSGRTFFTVKASDVWSIVFLLFMLTSGFCLAVSFHPLFGPLLLPFLLHSLLCSGPSAIIAPLSM